MKIVPKKSLGQNFLADINIINKGIQTINGIIYISEKVLIPAQF